MDGARRRAALRLDSGWWRRFAELGWVYGPEWWKRGSPPVIAAIIFSIARDRRAAVLRNQRQVRGPRGWLRERWDAYRVFAEFARSMTESLARIQHAARPLGRTHSRGDRGADRARRRRGPCGADRVGADSQDGTTSLGGQR